jgi:hypothetical protein
MALEGALLASADRRRRAAPLGSARPRARPHALRVFGGYVYALLQSGVEVTRLRGRTAVMDKAWLACDVPRVWTWAIR